MELGLGAPGENSNEDPKGHDHGAESISRIKFTHVNAFTDQAFGGNPAAVCLLPRKKSNNWMQLVAREFNLPATAFVTERHGQSPNGASNAGTPAVNEFDNEFEIFDNAVRREERFDDEFERIDRAVRREERSDNEFDMRWFSISGELELCGHGTLAAAHMLFSSGSVKGDTVVFHTQKGVKLKAKKVSGYDGISHGAQSKDESVLGKGVIELDFPLALASEVDESEKMVVKDALGGVKVGWVGKTQMGDYLVEMPSRAALESLRPDFEKMRRFGGRGSVYATAKSGSTRFDFVSRVFGPKIGIPEDQVTGSAHCTLGPYWAAKLGKENLLAFQASPRGGEVFVRVDADAGRAYLHGGAVLVMAGSVYDE